MHLPNTKVLVVSGPTATGKTGFALRMAGELDGELISADSRQVYTGRDLITGKDIPPNLKPQISNLKWKDRDLKYYVIDGVKVWLYDVVDAGQEFNVSFWRECAQLVIKDIHDRNMLPIIVGGTGLFIKSLLQPMETVDIPVDKQLRTELENKDVNYLFNYLNDLNPSTAKKLNESDKKNPRRLIRAIEVSRVPAKSERTEGERPNFDTLLIGLTTAKESLFERVDERVDQRILAGAALEDPQLANNPKQWKELERQIVRQQLTWFKKQANTAWFDIRDTNWQSEAKNLILKWYN